VSDVIDLTQRQEIPAFHRRLIQERNDLEEKIEGLITFLESDKKGSLSLLMLDAMMCQLEHMEGYLTSLDIRLSVLEEGL
jgi:hypothetical protein